MLRTKMKIYGLAIVLSLSMYAYRKLQQRRNATYDVFLSFRGEDARSGFADFLCKTLKNAKLRVFLDTDEFPAGRDLEQHLVQVIRTCKIVIPIISENYARSKYCLLELTETLDCHRELGKRVFPVFYKVNADDVACQRGELGVALSGHEQIFSSEEVQKWRDELTFVSRIRGWISKNIADGREGKLVDKVQEKVSSELWIERLPSFIKSAYLYFCGKGKWQVFLAFCSRDVRNGLAAFLRAGLESKGVRVFRHDDESLIGGNVDHQIWDAIEQCTIHIPIISENFASSTWCLKELSRMVELRTNNPTTQIFPIFYEVSQKQVEDASGRFGNDMLRHGEQEVRNNLNRWRHAFKVVGRCKGRASNEIADGDLAELVQRVVEDVLEELSYPRARPAIPIH